jgi:hypothetical protein
MTIDVLRVRTDRIPGKGCETGPIHGGDATIDVSGIPAEDLEAYVGRAIGENHEERYLERRGTRTTLTVVREPPTTESPDAPRSSSAPDGPPSWTAANRSSAKGSEMKGTNAEGSDVSGSHCEWNYAVFATESTPQ